MAVTVIPILTSGRYEQEIARGGQVLADGGLIILPTETVYGTAGRADRPEARRRLIDSRPAEDRSRPLTIHLADPADAAAYLGPLSSLSKRLTARLWPGPVGLSFAVDPDRQRHVAQTTGIPAELLYQDGQITLRCPDHPVTGDLLRAARGPVAVLAWTDKAGQPIHRIDPADLDDRADLAFDAGPTRLSKPSTLLRVHDDRYEVVRAGQLDARMIDNLLRTTLLFVCSGNTCRSPMAEALARKQLAERLGVAAGSLDQRGVSVVSAGVFTVSGAPATPAAVQAVRPLGGDLSAHRSRPLTIELINRADRIYAMGRSHAAAIAAMVPSAATKTTLLDPAGEIEDPIGGDPALYRDLAGKMDLLIRQRLDENPLLGSD